MAPVEHWPGHLVELPTGRLHVRTAPATAEGADRAVMVHGLGGAATNWTDVMALLRDRVEAVAPDLPGFGWSPPPPDDDYSLRAHVRAVTELIEAGGAGPVHLLGNSLGGTVSTVLAATRPDLVRTLDRGRRGADVQPPGGQLDLVPGPVLDRRHGAQPVTSPSICSTRRFTAASTPRITACRASSRTTDARESRWVPRSATSETTTRAVRS